MNDEIRREFPEMDRGGTGRKPKKRQNIVLIITDQQRQAQHWPPGWIEENMPTMARLQKNGVTFTNCYTAATACSPSRASFMTGVYPSLNGVSDTPPDPPLRADITNIFKLAENAGYKVAYKGKMHLFTPQCTPSEYNFTSSDIKWAEQQYSFNEWNPPDAALTPGGNVWIAGGVPNNDLRFVHGLPPEASCMTPGVGEEESILDFLEKHDPDEEPPFLLVCSLGNPHDISLWPYQYEWGYDADDCTGLEEIHLPPNYNDDLGEKPVAQSEFVKLTDVTDPSPGTQSHIDYCRFYAYLHKVVDKQIAAVLDKLDERHLTDDTVIFRFADHGEQSWSHGMIQKGCNSYQETINVPLIISNPLLPNKGKTTSSFASLIDLLPTIAELTGAATPAHLRHRDIRGHSLVPIMNDPTASVRNNIMFFSEDFQSFFNQYLGTTNLFETMPGKIRSIRFEDWMYAVYFTDNCTRLQYEMYNLTDDPLQMKNLAWYPRIKRYLPKMQELHDRLTVELEIYNATPHRWPSKTGTDSVWNLKSSKL